MENAVIEQKKISVIGRPFLKGQSGNPAGRPAGCLDYATRWRKAIEKIADGRGMTPEEVEDELLASGFDKAFKDFRYFKEHIDRRFGKVEQRTDMHVTGGLTLTAILDKSDALVPPTKEEHTALEPPSSS